MKGIKEMEKVREIWNLQICSLASARCGVTFPGLDSHMENDIYWLDQQEGPVDYQ